MNPLTTNPAIALDHARRTNQEDIRRAEQRRIARELRLATKDPRPRRFTWPRLSWHPVRRRAATG